MIVTFCPQLHEIYTSLMKQPFIHHGKMSEGMSHHTDLFESLNWFLGLIDANKLNISKLVFFLVILTQYWCSSLILWS